MTGLTCMAVRQRLAAFHDDELPVQEQIAVQGHLYDCRACRDELHDGYHSVSDALRLAAAPGPADDWTGLQPGVISRMRAEANEAWPARLGRMFDDMHLVWIGLAATAGTVLCGAIVLGMLRFASPERDDSLLAMITIMAAPQRGQCQRLEVSEGLWHVPVSAGAKGLKASSYRHSSRLVSGAKPVFCYKSGARNRNFMDLASLSWFSTHVRRPL